MKAYKIHKRLLDNAVPYVTALCQEKNDYISEGDIVDVLKESFKNNRFRNMTAIGEREGRKDYVIYENDIPKNIYEVKTYFKPNERFDYATAISEIKKDLLKLAERKNNAIGYFLFVCSKKMFKQCGEVSNLEFITDLANQGKKYTIPVLTKEVTVITKLRIESDSFYIMSFSVEQL